MQVENNSVKDVTSKVHAPQDDQSPSDGSQTDAAESSHSPSKKFSRWAGFSNKTLFDWLDVVAVPAIVTLATLGLGILQISITQDNQRSELMSTYYERMQELLIEHKMGNPSSDERIRSMGGALTFSTFRQLDGERKGELLKFLYQAKLINPQCQANPDLTQPPICEKPIINLGGAKLSKTSFESGESVNLPGVNLEGAILNDAELPGIQLSKAKMNHIRLPGANLENAFLNEADLKNANLNNANLKNVKLYKTNLTYALMRNAVFNKATLLETDLRCAELQGADLRNIEKIENVKFKNAKYDHTTSFPDNFVPQERGLLEVAPKDGLKGECLLE